MERDIIIAEAIPLATEALEPAWDYVDEATGTAGKPFYKRASGIASLAIGAIGTAMAFLGGRVGLGHEARLVAAVFGGKYLGKFIRMALEHYAAKAAAEKLAAELGAFQLAPAKEEEAVEAEVKVVTAEATEAVEEAVY